MAAMVLLSWFKNVAGLISLSCLFFFVMIAGRVYAGFYGFTLPSLSFNERVFAVPVASPPASTTDTLLLIDKLNLRVPVITHVPLDDQNAYEVALQKGVALAQGTADLSSLSGNSVLFAHSSPPSLFGKPSPFDTIFAGLPRLELGDKLQTIQNGQTTTYQVTVSQAIAPTDYTFLTSTFDHRLTLFTCWPLLSDQKRWLVQAQKIY